MATITEDYCSQEVYRLLLEKGFDGEIHTTYDKRGIYTTIYHASNGNEVVERSS